MNAQVFVLFWNICLLAGGVFTLYGIYFVGLALFGFGKNNSNIKTSPNTRFAVLIAARNEAAVVGNLVKSLLQQNYPKDKYDIIVAPNNCTDNTKEIAEKEGAIIFEPAGVIKSKGEVLSQLIKKLMNTNEYDAICVFDADNLVHENFLQEMNNEFRQGAVAAQGFRDSKNPLDTAISTSYSICYWMVNKFYNGGRKALGLSSLINGSGFMVSMDLLRKLGGWNTVTMTEDYEFTAQCVMLGHKVEYVPTAIIYDEQPLTFSQSWKQRRRWSTGSLEGMELYFSELVKQSIKQKSWLPMDLALTFITPFVQIISLLFSLFTVLLSFYGIIELNIFPITQVLGNTMLLAIGTFMACTLVATFVVWLNRGDRMEGTGKGILFFAFFLASWLPISIISIFKRQKNWDSIAHTCKVDLTSMNG